MQINNKKFLILSLAILIASQSVMAIEETPTKKSKFSFFKREKNEVRLEKEKKEKRYEVREVELPAVSKMRKPTADFATMTIEDCVSYAISNNPNLSIGLQQIKASNAGIGKQRSSYAPKLTARVGYNHLANSGTRIATTHNDSVGFNAGISQLIWDFGKTTARINMAKFDTLSAQYDYDYDVLNVIYNVTEPNRDKLSCIYELKPAYESYYFIQHYDEYKKQFVQYRLPIKNIMISNLKEQKNK